MVKPSTLLMIIWDFQGAVIFDIMSFSGGTYLLAYLANTNAWVQPHTHLLCAHPQHPNLFLELKKVRMVVARPLLMK